MRARMTFVTAAILGRREGREGGIRGGIVDFALRAPFFSSLLCRFGRPFISDYVSFFFFFFPALVRSMFYR